jgi:shikimate kinase
MVDMEAPTTPYNSTRPASGVICRIYLVGFMGAGKSTVGRLLAERLGWHFYDVDRVIEQEQDASVGSIFSAQGEEAFRRLEHSAIQRLHRAGQAVISLGGGAVETAEVRALIKQEPDSLVIFLHAPLHLLIERCMAQDGGSARPVLQQPERLQTRYNLRLTYYRNAHLTVETETLSPEKVAATILDRLAALQNANDPYIADNFRDHRG